MYLNQVLNCARFFDVGNHILHILMVIMFIVIMPMMIVPMIVVLMVTAARHRFHNTLLETGPDTVFRVGVSFFSSRVGGELFENLRRSRCKRLRRS